MAVDKAKVANLVAEMKADAEAREVLYALADAKHKEEVAKLVAEGGCAECMVLYCECY